jgi:hypothetical protein
MPVVTPVCAGTVQVLMVVERVVADNHGEGGIWRSSRCLTLAGGQSLVPIMAFRLARPALLININCRPQFA